MTEFEAVLRQRRAWPLKAGPVETLQINVGLRCNQRCRHCHLVCGPGRKEWMTLATARSAVALIERNRPARVDLTGGAPELHPCLLMLVEAAQRAGASVSVRTNLTALFTRAANGIAESLAERRVEIIASLPCYYRKNVDAQRGAGVFKESIEVIRRLNSLGYGMRPGWTLRLVHNPVGPSLPPAARDLEADYRAELREWWGVDFTSLLTMTNMPIGRFARDLRRQGNLAAYEQLLRSSFNPKTLPRLMCRRQVSLAWDGHLYDCDFNLALGLPANVQAKSLARFDLKRAKGRQIVTGEHCFGCTAGQGSSCTGALA